MHIQMQKKKEEKENGKTRPLNLLQLKKELLTETLPFVLFIFIASKQACKSV